MSSPSAHPAAERFPNGPFTRYMVGEGISMTGTWMQGMALGWVMTEIVARDGLQSYEGLLQAAPHLASGVVMLLLFRLGGAWPRPSPSTGRSSTPPVSSVPPPPATSSGATARNGPSTSTRPRSWR